MRIVVRFDAARGLHRALARRRKFHEHRRSVHGRRSADASEAKRRDDVHTEATVGSAVPREAPRRLMRFKDALRPVPLTFDERRFWLKHGSTPAVREESLAVRRKDPVRLAEEQPLAPPRRRELLDLLSDTSGTPRPQTGDRALRARISEGAEHASTDWATATPENSWNDDDGEDRDDGDGEALSTSTSSLESAPLVRSNAAVSSPTSASNAKARSDAGSTARAEWISEPPRTAPNGARANFRSTIRSSVDDDEALVFGDSTVNTYWNEEAVQIETTLRSTYYAVLPVPHVRPTHSQWAVMREAVVEGYLDKVRPLGRVVGYVASLPRLRTKIRVLADHPLLVTYMKMLMQPSVESDTGEDAAITLYGAAGFAPTLTQAQQMGLTDDNMERFYAVRDGEVLFCGSFHTEIFRDAASVALASLWGPHALLLRSAVMARGNLRVAHPTRPSLVAGHGAARGDFAGGNHVWTDEGLSFVWYAETWDPRRHLFRDKPVAHDLVEGSNRRATRRIPADTPALLLPPEEIIVSFGFGRESANVYRVSRPEELAYFFLLSGGSPAQEPDEQYDATLEFLRLVRQSRYKKVAAVWGNKAEQVAKKLAEGYANLGGKMGSADRLRAERFRREYFPQVPCNDCEIVVRSQIPADAEPGWQPPN